MRIALICALTVLIAQINGIPEIALAAYVVFFMNTADRTSSILSAVLFLIIVNFLIGLLILLAGRVMDVVPLRILAMVMLSIALLFLASASKLKPLAPIIALILVYALDVIGHIPSGELVTRALLYAWLIIVIPCVVTIVVNLLIGPPPLMLASASLAAKLRIGAQALAKPGEGALATLESVRAQGAAATLGFLHLAGVERATSKVQLSALRAAVHSTEALLMLSACIAGTDGIPQPWKAKAAATLEGMANIFSSSSYPLDIATVPAEAEGYSPAGARLAAEFNRLLHEFTSHAAIPTGEGKETGTRFFVADAWSNPAHLRYALKVTAAAMICYLFYALTDWQGIHTSLITCYVVALGTLAETTEKLLLRIVGALVGAAIGLCMIIRVIPALDDIGGLLLLIGGAGFVGGWIVASGPRVSYIGFQFAFAIFLCVLQGAAPAFDLALARDRILGILLGNAVTYVVFAHIWPVSIAPRIGMASTALLQRLIEIISISPDSKRVHLLPDAHGQAHRILADVEVARYEPAAMRPSRAWFDKQHHLLEAALATEKTLLLRDSDAVLTPTIARLKDLMPASTQHRTNAEGAAASALQQGEA